MLGLDPAVASAATDVHFVLVAPVRVLLVDLDGVCEVVLLVDDDLIIIMTVSFLRALDSLRLTDHRHWLGVLVPALVVTIPPAGCVHDVSDHLVHQSGAVWISVVCMRNDRSRVQNLLLSGTNQLLLVELLIYLVLVRLLMGCLAPPSDLRKSSCPLLLLSSGIVHRHIMEHVVDHVDDTIVVLAIWIIHEVILNLCLKGRIHDLAALLADLRSLDYRAGRYLLHLLHVVMHVVSHLRKLLLLVEVVLLVVLRKRLLVVSVVHALSQDPPGHRV